MPNWAYAIKLLIELGIRSDREEHNRPSMWPTHAHGAGYRIWKILTNLLRLLVTRKNPQPWNINPI